MRRFLMLAVLPVALTAQAYAQTSPAAEPSKAAPAASGAMMPNAPSGAMMPKAMSVDLEKHITRLHDQLGITAAQQSQWDAFAQVMRDNAASMKQALEDRGGKLATMNAVETMQSYARIVQVHADNMQKLAAAFGTLYGAMTEPQKQEADRVYRNKAESGPHHPS